MIFKVIRTSNWRAERPHYRAYLVGDKWYINIADLNDLIVLAKQNDIIVSYNEIASIEIYDQPRED